VRRMKLQGNWLGGTCVVTFEDVKVPVNMMIGKENEGFKPLMTNFNHERFVIASQAVRQARLCLVTLASPYLTFTLILSHSRPRLRLEPWCVPGRCDRIRLEARNVR
jgi:hypothetical protein